MLFVVLNMRKRTLILLLLALVAIVLYGIGFKTASLTIIILAACVELGFWFKLFSNEDKTHTD